MKFDQWRKLMCLIQQKTQSILNSKSIETRIFFIDWLIDFVDKIKLHKTNQFFVCSYPLSLSLVFYLFLIIFTIYLHFYNSNRIQSNPIESIDVHQQNKTISLSSLPWMTFACLVQSGLLSFFDSTIFGQKSAQSHLFNCLRFHKTTQSLRNSVTNGTGQSWFGMQILTFHVNVHFGQHVGTFESGEDLFTAKRQEMRNLITQVNSEVKPTDEFVLQKIEDCALHSK